MIFYCSASYLAECCPRPHGFLKRIVAKDKAEAHDKFVVALRGTGLHEEQINDAEVWIVKHTTLVGGGERMTPHGHGHGS